MLFAWRKICCVALLLVALAGLAGCGSHEAPAINPDALRQALVDKTWTLERMVNRDMESDPPLTLKFNADGTVDGFGGCNTFRGEYTLEGKNLTFGTLASARKSCGPAADEQEYAFMTFLAQVGTVSIDEDELSLFTDTQAEMLLTSGGSGFLW